MAKKEVKNTVKNGTKKSKKPIKWVPAPLECIAKEPEYWIEDDKGNWVKKIRRKK